MLDVHKGQKTNAEHSEDYYLDKRRYESFKKARQITDEDYDSLDKLHYMVENKLLKLIESLQKKQKDKEWEDNLSNKNYT